VSTQRAGCGGSTSRRASITSKVNSFPGCIVKLERHANGSCNFIQEHDLHLERHAPLRRAVFIDNANASTRRVSGLLGQTFLDADGNPTKGRLRVLPEASRWHRRGGSEQPAGPKPPAR
jgi:hypothetical protein